MGLFDIFVLFSILYENVYGCLQTPGLFSSGTNNYIYNVGTDLRMFACTKDVCACENVLLNLICLGEFFKNTFFHNFVPFSSEDFKFLIDAISTIISNMANVKKSCPCEKTITFYYTFLQGLEFPIQACTFLFHKKKEKFQCLLVQS